MTARTPPDLPFESRIEPRSAEARRLEGEGLLDDLPGRSPPALVGASRRAREGGGPGEAP